MKSALVITLIIIAVIVATIVHSAKINHETDDIDKMASGLKGIEKVLPVNSNISIQSFGVPDQAWLYCRYLLVPRYCVLYKPLVDTKGKFDTLLALAPVSATDSLLHVITDNKKIIWEGADQQYKYYLTCNNR